MRNHIRLLAGAVLLMAAAAPVAARGQDKSNTMFGRMLDEMLKDPETSANVDPETRTYLERFQAWFARVDPQNVTEEDLERMPQPPRYTGGDTTVLVDRIRTEQEHRLLMEELKKRPTHDEQFAKELGISVDAFREHTNRLRQKTAADLGLSVEQLEQNELAARIQAAKTEQERLRDDARRALEIIEGRGPKLPGSEGFPAAGRALPGSDGFSKAPQLRPSPGKPSRPCPPGPGSCASQQ